MARTAPEPPNRRDALVQTALRPHEQILWQGRPVPRYAMWSGTPGKRWWSWGFGQAVGLAVLSLFALPGAVFARQAWLALRAPDDALHALGLVAALLVATAGALLPFYLFVVRRRLAALRNARDAHYVLTNQRALVLLIRGGRVEDEMAHELRHIDVDRPELHWLRRNGCGSVLYATGGEIASDAGSTPYSVLYDVGFEGVPDAQRVYRLVQDAVRAAQRGKRRSRAA